MVLVCNMAFRCAMGEAHSGRSDDECRYRVRVGWVPVFFLTKRRHGEEGRAKT